MSRLLCLFFVISACSARLATDNFPFTPRATVEPHVSCSSDDDCGHGFCRKSQCMCDYNWATLEAEEPCMYARYSKTTALLLQIFLGVFGVGITVLDWYGAIAMYWSFFIILCCSSTAFGVYKESDEDVGKGICACMLWGLSSIALFGTYVTSVVYIAGHQCMDGNGIACGS